MIVVPVTADVSSLPALPRASLSDDGSARDPKPCRAVVFQDRDQGATVDQIPQDRPVACPRLELATVLVLKRVHGVGEDVSGPPSISADAAAKALRDYFLANADRDDNAANDQLVAELVRRIRAQRASRNGGC